MTLASVLPTLYSNMCLATVDSCTLATNAVIGYTAYWTMLELHIIKVVIHFLDTRKHFDRQVLVHWLFVGGSAECRLLSSTSMLIFVHFLVL